ncbi:MAG: hypothetical protein OEW90_16080 [Betaproteobacteria bacterium]|nr:hypothetical protein [Betaproteobacteria bacterium]MDH5210354.1 hypothetical protein [Betaproteobacteria bacterium]
MSELVAPRVASAAPRAASAATRPARDLRVQSGRERMFLAGALALVALAWLVSRYANYKSGSPLGYNLGIAGGVGLLVILLYPLRKRVRFLSGLGQTKSWFALHMTCGVLAPFLILVHSKFHIGSINAGVSLVCMLLVATSGFIGRFIYVRIHHGLYGTRMTLAELQAQVGFNSGEVRSKLSFVPRVEQWLREYEAAAVGRPKNIVQGLWRFLTLGARARWVRRRSTREFARVYRMHARAFNWDAARQRRHLAGGTELIANFVAGAQRVAQFSRYERLFSLWHVLHVPLLWMMVLSAIAHVVAVHAY